VDIYDKNLANMLKNTQRHPLEHEELTWRSYHWTGAYGYYGKMSYDKQPHLDRMYCKVDRKGEGQWMFYRSDYNGSGYLEPIVMEGVTTLQEAKAVAQVWYFINGWEIIFAQKDEQRGEQ
jgi:hypothetical protein